MSTHLRKNRFKLKSKIRIIVCLIRKKLNLYCCDGSQYSSRKLNSEKISQINPVKAKRNKLECLYLYDRILCFKKHLSPMVSHVRTMWAPL